MSTGEVGPGSGELAAPGGVRDGAGVGLAQAKSKRAKARQAKKGREWFKIKLRVAMIFSPGIERGNLL